MADGWFRLDNTVVSDPKVQMLAPELFKHWINILCIASQNRGELPKLDIIAYQLGRLSAAATAKILSELTAAGLLDKTENSFTPHNWGKRQFLSERYDPTNKDRQRRWRKSHPKPPDDGGKSVDNVVRNAGENEERNADSNVTRNAPHTHTHTHKDSGAKAPDAEASDPRTRLFREGLEKLAKITGKGPDACRSFVGKCLKAADDDAVTVLGLIEEAERNRVANPSAWISAHLKPHERMVINGTARPKSAIIQAADDLCERLAGFDGPARGPDELRSSAGEASPRLLSNGRGK